MFSTLPHTFREHGLQADVRTLLLLRKSLERGLVRTLGDLYLVLKGLVTNDPKDYGPFSEAFYAYFLTIDFQPGEKLEQAIQRSRVYQEWLEREDLLDEETDEDLVDRFLNEIHMSSYDIQQMLDGEAIFREDNPDLADTDDIPDEQGMADTDDSPIQQGADYSNMSLEELLERMRQIAEQQKTQHRGGSHWIGQGGMSPYGHGGAAAGGIRLGGPGGGKMARKVIGDRQYYPVDRKMPLQDDNIDVALSFLKGIEEESAQSILDIPETVREGVRQGGLFLPVQKDKKEQKLQAILMVDNGGRSMTPYVRMILKLFSKMKRRFAHDLKTYYFHNTIYGGAYTDPARRNFEPIDKILANAKDYQVFVIGDADMAPYELSQSSIAQWQSIHARFPRAVWLNPLRERYWEYAFTVSIIKSFFPMYPLTVGGLEKAVLYLNSKKV
ncbi:hypothetical protein [Lewinella cohaerens]|uniref:hypothetical protein n=1 Tax=Lewinella cohaerens TaxID=70995 RepID=UPI00037AD0D8|nr:hypothetical protein [Lewinella cohaerens]